ncbi:unnamed protein product [Musa acuminata subsp. burmannicoides]
MAAASGSRTHSECNPNCEWTEVGELDALKTENTLHASCDDMINELQTSFLLHLLFDTGLGFKKEELKVLVDTSRKLTISGERALRDGQWRRFLRSFQLPKHCNIGELGAKFDQEILYVILPKPTNEMKQSGGVLKALSNRRLILTGVAAIVLVAGLGAFAAYKLTRS